jgi:hypothetical protein
MDSEVSERHHTWHRRCARYQQQYRIESKPQQECS